MKKTTLDFTNCKNLYDLHNRIQESLNFPDYYGKNLDAFWDCLNRDCDVNYVTVVGSENVAAELKPTMKTILELFEENKKFWAESTDPFDYEILS